MSDRHYTDLPIHLPDPPAPPQLVRLAVHGPDGVRVYEDVKEWSTMPPHTFKFEMLDGEVVLLDMPGRDFVIRPQ